MTPETNIITALPNFWVEKFPEGNSDAYPKGLVKRVSSPLVNEKDRSTPRQYNSRISLLWYDVDSRGFDVKMEAILTAMYGVESDVKIKNVKMANRTDGYDVVTDMHVMGIDFIVKHFV